MEQLDQRVVRLGAFYYKIRIMDDLKDEKDGQELFGRVSFAKQEIQLDSCLTSPLAFQEVLWHEVIHIILTQAGYQNQDEFLIDGIAFGIMNVLEANPWMASIAPSFPLEAKS